MRVFFLRTDLAPRTVGILSGLSGVGFPMRIPKGYEAPKDRA